MKAWKTMIWAAMIFFLTTGSALAIPVPPGAVSGTWTTGNTYEIMGEISVPAGQTLNIEPGVQVIFQGHYKFIVNGLLQAIGAETDSILFTAADTALGWDGIHFVSLASTSQLEYCILEYGRATGSWPMHNGGAIYIYYSNPLITRCTIARNTALNWGGGVWCDHSSPTISYCTIIQNSAWSGGGFLCEYSSPIISNCYFTDNYSNNGGVGVWFYTDSNGTLSNCLFSGNSTPGVGGGICSTYNLNSTIENCTIVGNSATGGGGGIYFDQSSTNVMNCLVWSNTTTQILIYTGSPQITYSDIQGSWPGTGNMDADPLFLAGPGGEYYLSQIAAGQTEQSPCVDAGNPASPMIEGTTRTDGIQDAGIVDMGYHYAITTSPPPPPPQWVDLTLLSSPTLPPTGGVVQYNIAGGNNDSVLVYLDVWVMATLPGGAAFGPIVGPIYDFNFWPNWSTDRDRNLVVGASAPAGSYSIDGYIGDYDLLDPTIIAEDHIFFTKTGMRALSSDPWLTDSGEPFPGEEVNPETERPDGFSLQVNISPNPFNPATTLRFNLLQSGWVRLEVFDVNGRNVAVGFGESDLQYFLPGMHQITFDGSNLPSGVYVYRLRAGELSALGKMVLLK